MARVDVLSSLASLAALRDRWDALCDAASSVTPFQRPGWILPWVERFDVRSPRALAVSCGRDLVGLVPLFASGEPPGRCLSLLGAGVSDHLDALAAPGHGRATLDALRGWLEDGGEDWSACWFDELGPRALLWDLQAPAGAKATAEPQSVCPVLVTEGEGTGGAVLERVVPRQQVTRARRALRRAERLGAVAFERHDGRGEFASALGALSSLHTRRWASRGEAGALSEARLVRFHQEVAVAFAARRALRLYVLYLGGREAAVIYGFREQARVHLYLQGIDPERDHVSPGTVLVAFVLRDALAEGAREVDFLRGSEPYKYAWGAVDEVNRRLQLVRTLGEVR